MRIHFFDVVLAEKYTAIKETMRNSKSIAFHHPGADVQQVVVHACAIKTNGVSMQ